jgi:hypothetical protein
MSSQAARATSKRVSEREFEDYIRTELRMRSGLGYRVRPHHGGLKNENNCGIFSSPKWLGMFNTTKEFE